MSAHLLKPSRTHNLAIHFPASQVAVVVCFGIDHMLEVLSDIRPGFEGRQLDAFIPKIIALVVSYHRVKG